MYREVLSSQRSARGVVFKFHNETLSIFVICPHKILRLVKKYGSYQCFDVPSYELGEICKSFTADESFMLPSCLFNWKFHFVSLKCEVEMSALLSPRR